MALGPRWLAYSPDKPYVSNSGRLSPKNLTTSGLSQSTSAGNGSIMARYAMESGKQVAAGIMNLGDMGYKKLSKYYPDLLPEPGWKVGKLTGSQLERAGMVSLFQLFVLLIGKQSNEETNTIYIIFETLIDFSAFSFFLKMVNYRSLLGMLFLQQLYHNLELMQVQYLLCVLIQVEPFLLLPQYMEIT